MEEKKSSSVAEEALLPSSSDSARRNSIQEFERWRTFKHHPFLNETPKVTCYEGCKMALMTVLLIPLIRVILVLVTIFVLSIWTSCFAIFLRRPDPKTHMPRPFSRPVRRFMWLGTSLARLTYVWMGVHWINERYIGKQTPRVLQSRARRCLTCCCWFGGGNSILRSEECPRVGVSSHVSFFDGLYYGSKALVGVVMKAGISRAPVCGRIISLMNPVLVPRTEKEKAMLPSVVNQLISRTHSDPKVIDPVLIFPEATTVNQRFMIQFQKGAFLPLAPVQPICIRFPHRHFDMSWTPGHPTLFMFYRALCQFHIPMEVLYLDPIDPPKPEELEGVDFMLLQGGRPVYLPRPPVAPPSSSRAEVADDGGAAAAASQYRHAECIEIACKTERDRKTLLAELFAEKVRKVMADAAGCETAPYSERDGFLWKHGLARGFGEYVLRKILPAVTIKELERCGRVNWRIVASIMTKFHSLDRDENGIVPKEAFIASFPAEQQEHAAKLYRVLDTRRNGFLDFRDVSLGMAAMFGDRGAQRLTEFAFAFLDTRDQYAITTEDILAAVTQYNHEPSTAVRQQVEDAVAACGLQSTGALSFHDFAQLARHAFHLFVGQALHVAHVFLGASADRDHKPMPKDLVAWKEAGKAAPADGLEAQ